MIVGLPEQGIPHEYFADGKPITQEEYERLIEMYDYTVRMDTPDEDPEEDQAEA